MATIWEAQDAGATAVIVPDGGAGVTSIKPTIKPTTLKTTTPKSTTPCPTYIVHTTAVKDDIGIGTLLGEYAEISSNHGRKVYKKEGKPAMDGVGEGTPTVFLYYWDMRDGPHFCGWWFGDQVGSSQVWSRCESADMTPPKTGWRIPYNGDVNSELLVDLKTEVVKTEVVEEQKKEDDATAKAQRQEVEDRIQMATDRVILAEVDATQALESVKGLLEGEITDEHLKVVGDLLHAQATALTEVSKALAVDTMLARKHAPNAVPALRKLQPRVRSVQAALVQDMKANQEFFSKRKQEDAEAKRQALAAERERLAEQRDAKAFKAGLPQVVDNVKQVEVLLDAVAAAAGPVSMDAPAEANDFTSAALAKTETAVAKAQGSIKAARAILNQKLAAAKQFAPQAREEAQQRYGQLQDQVNDFQSRLAPYARTRADFEQRLEARRVLTDVTKRICETEAEVEQVTTLSSAEPSDQDIRSVESAVALALAKVTKLLDFIRQHLQNDGLGLKEDLMQMLERGRECNKRLDDFRLRLYTLLEGLQLETIVKDANAKVVAAEESLLKATEAGEPFSQGIEALPASGLESIVSDCRSAVSATNDRVNEARAYLVSKATVVKCFPEEARSASVSDLAKLQARVDTVATNLQRYRQRMAEWETASLLQEGTFKVAEVEANVNLLSGLTVALETDLKGADTDVIREAITQVLDLEKSASITAADARKILKSKSDDGTELEDSPLSAQVQKLQTRLTTAQYDLGKQRKAALKAEYMWKNMALVKEQADKISELERDINRAELLTVPLGDEVLSEQTVQEMDEIMTAAQGKLDQIVPALEAARATVKADVAVQLSELSERAAQGQSRLDEMQETTREQRERLRCDVVLRNLEGTLQQLAQSRSKLSDAEVPYHKGAEKLTVAVATQAMADSEAAIVAVQSKIEEARRIFGEQRQGLRRFLPVIAKAGLKQMGVLAKRIPEVVEALASFQKETEGRRSILSQQEAVSCVDELEEAVREVLEMSTAFLVKEFTYHEDIMSEATEELENYAAIEQTAREKMDRAMRLLSARQREGKSQEVARLQGRVSELEAELAKAKAVASEQEQGFVAKMIIAEANRFVQSLETEVDKAFVEVAPLLAENGRRFVVASMCRKVVDALRQDGHKRGMTMDAVFASIGPGAKAGQASKKEVVAFLGQLPKRLGRDDLQISEEQLALIFSHMDSDGDGVLSKSEFLGLLFDGYLCVNAISITDAFDLVGDVKTIGKLEVGEVVDTLGSPKTHPSLGMMRVEVRSRSDGTRGWATMQSNQGKPYLSMETPFTAFSRALEKTLAATQASAKKVTGYLDAKIEELGRCEKGPLAKAKSELEHLKPKLELVYERFDMLQKQIEESKSEHAQREWVEQRDHNDRVDQAAVVEVLAMLTSKVEAAEKSFESLQKTASQLVNDIMSVPDPIAALEAGKAQNVKFDPSRAEAKACLSAHEGKITKAVSGPWAEAKKTMKDLKQRVDAIDGQAAELMEGMEEAVDILTDVKKGQVAAALRKWMHLKGMSTEDLFRELSGHDERVLEAAFSTHLKKKMPDFKLPLAHQRLIFRQCGGRGLTRREFFEMIERYYHCVREIAITTEFDIKSCNTICKLECGEVVELVEGPRTDAELGVMRIRARSLVSGTSGWITATGNHGTLFLTQTPKPYRHVAKGVTLTDDFASGEAKAVCDMKVHDVVEILEGPRLETCGNAMRGRGKCVSDGAVGWFTFTSKAGVECVAPGQSKYTCVASVALTDQSEINDCKVVRKLAKGETLLMLEGPVDDEEAGVQRIRVRAAQDNAEGWVTTRGKNGSIYARETTRQVVVTRPMALESKLDCDAGNVVRMLAAGELLEVSDGPREEKSGPPSRVRVHVVSNGRMGWLTDRADTLIPWSPIYRCKIAAPIHASQAPDDAFVQRTLDVDEEVEHVEGPHWDQNISAFRIYVRARRDRQLGWVTMTSDKGAAVLENVEPE